LQLFLVFIQQIPGIFTPPLADNNCDIEFWTSSWTPFPLYAYLNSSSQDCKDDAYSFKDKIELHEHPVFRGIDGEYLELGDKKSFKTYDLNWNVLVNNQDKDEPTMLETKFGKGRFLIVGSAVSYWYGKRFHANILFDNVINYTKSIALQAKKEVTQEKKDKEARLAVQITRDSLKAISDSVALVNKAREDSIEAAESKEENLQNKKY